MSQTPDSSPMPIPPAPPRAVLSVRALFRLREAKRRWPFALRAAFCMGVPVLAGWGAGDVPAGLMATIGAFTALYGSGRPYLNRAGHLASIALSFALSVGLGVWASSEPWLAVSTVALIAIVSTFLCNALRVAPPGAYMFVLASAAGTGMDATHIGPLHAAVLVMAGGGLAWAIHMGGAFLWPRGPEKAAVAAGAKSVARFIGAVNSPQSDATRHGAALAIYDAWTTLVSHQPARPRPDGALSRLRALGRQLNLHFVEAMNAAAEGRPMPPAAVDATMRIAELAENPPPGGERTDPTHLPLGHPGLLESLRQAFRPWSPSLLVAARAGLAAVIAGTIGAAFGLERTYWTTAAAVLMLHQGFDWTRTLQRGLERLSGTWAGLIVAGAILVFHPQGLWLAAILMALQFIIEMIVVRNYALAVMFITPAALTIAAGGHPVADVGHLLWVRGVDTTIGCAVGLLVFVLTTPRQAAVRIPQEMAGTLAAAERMVAHLAAGDANSAAARTAQRDLQQGAIAILQAYDASVGATPAHRSVAEQMWPAVVATQRLAYRLLSIQGLQGSAARNLFGTGEEAATRRALRHLAAAVRSGSKPAETSGLPDCLVAEITVLRNSLVHAAA